MSWRLHVAIFGPVRPSSWPLSFVDPLLTFPTAFDSSDGIVTSLKARPPPGVENVFDLGEHDIDGDYDVPVEDTTRDPVETVPPTDEATPILPERTVKAYVVKYTAYKTFVGSWNLRRSLMDETQSARDHLVYLFRRDCFLPQLLSSHPERLRQVCLFVCR